MHQLATSRPFEKHRALNARQLTLLDRLLVSKLPIGVALPEAGQVLVDGLLGIPLDAACQRLKPHHLQTQSISLCATCLGQELHPLQKATLSFLSEQVMLLLACRSMKRCIAMMNSAVLAKPIVLLHSGSRGCGWLLVESDTAAHDVMTLCVLVHALRVTLIERV